MPKVTLVPVLKVKVCIIVIDFTASEKTMLGRINLNSGAHINKIGLDLIHGQQTNTKDLAVPSNRLENTYQD
jgi:ornithine cyclodeaminase/alanine dehydrogenase-like protein (mu-crystallin family)